ncbi:MAG: ParB N-terminal domain-containing protein, partial [Ruminiclostridium sp.]|nr:ParB N-terminal domain-containing protein [Ruminiclostridium sp.]
ESKLKRFMELNDDEEIEEYADSEAFEFPLAQMEEFPDHKFATFEGQRLDDMVDSIKEFGVIEPIILWKHDNKHTIISGHNRKKAALIAGLTTAPVKVCTDLTLEQATLIVGESNFRQRSFSDMKHSNRAVCLASHYKLMKAQGIRNDITNEIKILEKADNGAENQTSPKIEAKLRSSKKMEEEYGLNHATISRYIRIAELSENLLDHLDNNRLAFMAAYELSFVTDEQCQQNLADYIYNGKKISIGGAKKLKEYYEKKKSLTKEEIEQVLAKPQGKGKSKSLQLKEAFLKKYFKGDNISNQDMEEIIGLALEAYFKNEEPAKETTEGALKDEKR